MLEKLQWYGAMPVLFVLVVEPMVAADWILAEPSYGSVAANPKVWPHKI